MKNRIKYVKRIQLIKNTAEPDLLAIKATGIAEISMHSTPVLVPKTYEEIPSDGIFEMDFRMEESQEDLTNVEIEVEVIIRIRNLPEWVKGVKINASDNSDIELI
jgi:hypothetical protein